MVWAAVQCFVLICQWFGLQYNVCFDLSMVWAAVQCFVLICQWFGLQYNVCFDLSRIGGRDLS